MATENSTQEEIGSKIKRLRTEKKMTQAELAEKMHVSSSAISKWERGQAGLDIHTACELAGIFGISVSELTERLSEAEENAEKQKDVKDADMQRKAHKHKALWVFMGDAFCCLSYIFASFLRLRKRISLQQTL